MTQDVPEPELVVGVVDGKVAASVCVGDHSEQCGLRSMVGIVYDGDTDSAHVMVTRLLPDGKPLTVCVAVPFALLTQAVDRCVDSPARALGIEHA